METEGSLQYLQDPILKPVLNHMKPVHNPPPYYCVFKFTIILQSMSRSLKKLYQFSD
jgi:hypothetical protein